MEGEAPTRFNELLAELKRQYEIDVREVSNQKANLELELQDYKAKYPPLTFPFQHFAELEPQSSLRSLSRGAFGAEASIEVLPPESLPHLLDTPGAAPDEDGAMQTQSLLPEERAVHFEIQQEWKQAHVHDVMLWGLEVDDERVKADMLKMRTASNPLAPGTSKKLGDTSEQSRFVVNPGSTIRMHWDVAGMLLMLYDIITVPLLVFEEEDNWFTVLMSWIALLFWTADMVWSANTGYYNSSGLLVMSRPSIIKQYVKTWFIVDCAVVIPDWIMTSLGSTADVGKLSKLLKAARALRVLRLLRLLKLRRLMSDLYDTVSSEYTFLVIELIKMLCLILLLNHWVACCWWLVGLISQQVGSRLNWLEDTGKTPVWNTDFGWKYSTCLHWSITQFTPASMDVSATNTGERFFSVLILFWALVALSSFLGSVSASITTMRSMAGERQKKFWLLRQYMKQRSLPEELKKRITKYVEHHLDAKSSKLPESKVVLLACLSQQLKNIMLYEASAAVLQVHRFLFLLAHRMSRVMHVVCQHAIKTRDIAETELVFQNEAEASSMYFVKAGEFHYRQNEERLEMYSYFSEASLWTRWFHRGDLTCLSAAGELVVVVADPFGKVLRSHSASYELAKRYAEDFVKHLNSLPAATLSDVTIHDSDWLRDEIGTLSSTRTAAKKKSWV